MILLEDTRQQRGEHTYKHEYFLANGISVRRVTLSVGDYQLAGLGSCAVDTKKDIQELIGNVQYRSPNKSKIIEAMNKVFDKYKVPVEHRQALVDMIWEDDTDRDVESEITLYFYQYKLNEGAVKPLCEIYVKRRGRFHRELIRAQIEGVKLYVLVENTGGFIGRTKVEQPYIGKLEDLHKWVNPRLFIMYKGKQKYPKAMKGATLQKACCTMEKNYGCKFLFCKPEDAGAMIMKILNTHLVRGSK